MTDLHKPSTHLSRRDILRGVSIAWAPGLAMADVGGTAIDWPALPLLDGGVLQPSAWVGTPAVVVFWATWCPYCKRHNAHIEKLYQQTLGRNLRVLGVVTETDKSKIGSYMQAQQFHFPVALADSSFRGQFTQRRIIPLTCLVSERGILKQTIPGEMSQEDVLSLASASWA